MYDEVYIEALRDKIHACTPHTTADALVVSHA